MYIANLIDVDSSGLALLSLVRGIKSTTLKASCLHPRDSDDSRELQTR